MSPEFSAEDIPKREASSSPARKRRLSWGRSSRLQISIFLILALALILRLGHWLSIRQDPFYSQLIMDSYEYDRWAQAIAAGDWLGREVFFQAPLYPYFLAGVYRLFGHHLDIVYLLQVLLACAGCMALYKAGEALGGRTLGLSAAFLAAIYGVFIFYDVQIQKESLAVTIITFLLWSVIAAREQNRTRVWFTVGVLCGLLSLLRENALFLAPFLLLLTFRRRTPVGPSLKKCGFFAVGLAIILLPVAVRNSMLGGGFLPTTFQGGTNFYIGNNPQANGTYQPVVPGKQMPYYERREPVRIAEQEAGRPLTPAEVSGYWLKKSWAWIKQHPADYLRLQFKKFLMYWSWYEWPDALDYYYIKESSPVIAASLLEFSGLFLLAMIGLWMIRSQVRKWAPVLVLVLVWMASVVIFFLFSRYRLPSLPGLMLLAAVPIASLPSAVKDKKNLTAGALLLGLVLAVGVSSLVRFKPKMDLTHYNLALIEERRGHPEAALAHYQKALAVNPNDFLFYNNIGNIYAQKNAWDIALSWYERAEAKEPQAEGVQINLGTALTALQRFDEAEKHLDLALELNPTSIEALHNKSVLLAQKGKITEALQINQKVLKLQPDWEPGIKLRAKLLALLPKK
jgi:4-amino-4-deoxy-L-arabinose transferase-like glycosyltransferase/Flp pilus assembly protein TadD